MSRKLYQGISQDQSSDTNPALPIIAVWARDGQLWVIAKETVNGYAINALKMSAVFFLTMQEFCISLPRYEKTIQVSPAD